MRHREAHTAVVLVRELWQRRSHRERPKQRWLRSMSRSEKRVEAESAKQRTAVQSRATGVCRHGMEFSACPSVQALCLVLIVSLSSLLLFMLRHI